jgi:predicted acylesterase/phospholipase RssA
MAEAGFGLGRYDAAVEWLRKGPSVSELPPWEFESAMQQLGAAVQLQADFQELMPEAPGPAPDPARARAALRAFLGSAAPGVERIVAGKFGLALSGGGFRASLFHIGVLAWLAERDVLRHVEVLSCVSGGSIIGAQYYLEVQRLLQEKADGDISRQDYVDIVHRLVADFLAGVQTNIRSQVLAELWTNLKAMFWPAYTRTQRLGELYESRLFSRVRDGKGHRPRFMDDLKFTPRGESPGIFKPKYDNWRRRNKVPTLVVNATTLNTGHNWQFTSTWMGEPPAGIDIEVDGNYRLRRLYYDDAPERFQHVRLGHAVAASSCVPGLFEPLVMKGLYPGKTVRLVDGGVFDNQGVASLLEQDCSVMLVSDASGQMTAVDEPSAGMIGVPLRSFNVSMARVRQAEYHELDARRRSSALRGLMFLHLKKDLDVDPVDWVDCQDPSDASEESRPRDRRGVLTRFGIRKDVQALLAAIRTDLDSFSDLEAYALMASGYRMAQHEGRRSIEDLLPRPEAAPAQSWAFLEVEPLLVPGPRFETVRKHLSVAGRGAFRAWRLSPPLTAVGIVLIAALAGAAAWAGYTFRDTQLVTVGSAGQTLLAAVATLVLGPTLIRIARFRKTIGQVGLVTMATVVASFAFRIHLAVFDRWFLRLGRLARFR